MYLEGLNSKGVKYFLGQQAAEVASNCNFIDQLSTEFLNVGQILKEKQLEKKSLKKYRKETKDKRIVVAEGGEVAATLRQIERGVGITLISKQSKAQALINQLLIENIQNKGFYKQQVKAYIKLYRKLEPSILPTSESKDWKSFNTQSKFKDITLISDANQDIPIRDLGNVELITISSNSAFETSINKYKSAKHLNPSVLQLSIDSLYSVLPKNAMVLVDLSSMKPQELDAALVICDTLNKHRLVIAFLEGNEVLLKRSDWQMPIIWNLGADSKLEIMVEMVFGARDISGALPGYYQADFTRKGVSTSKNGRLTYHNAAHKHVNAQTLDQIDSLVGQAIKEEMMPGCQIMMIKDGQVVYDRSFGYLTYDSLTAVRWDHVYDIASVTKTVATVPALMHRMEQGEVNLNGFLGDYLTDIDSTKAQLALDDILTHQSGLKSYLPFWRNAKYFADESNFLYKKKKWRRRYTYHSVHWGDSIQTWIGNSQYNSLSNEDGTFRYLYSDLGFMLMKDVVEDNCQCAFDQSLDQLLYKPLGMNFTSFNPLERFSKEQIAPTEQDKFFRSELLRGVVHDKNAAILGGVNGHAGLFS